jgi:hypothetical protein
MDEYITSVILEINGKKITDFKSVSEDARVLRKTVPLMGKTGKAAVTPRHGLSLEYVIPAKRAEFDFASVDNCTVTFVKETGRVIFTGVSTLEIGETKYDGENESTRMIKFVADARREE